MSHDVTVDMQSTFIYVALSKQTVHTEQREIKLPSGESTLRPDERLPLRDEFFSGRDPSVDMDCEMLRCKFDFGAKSVLNLDFFFTPGD